MNSIRFPTWALLTVWLGSFALSLAVVIGMSGYFDDRFEPLFNHIIDAYAPYLAIMLTCLYSRSARNPPLQHQSGGRVAVAVLVSVLWNAAFLYVILGLYFQAFGSEHAIDLFQTIRPKLSFVPAAAITYYFSPGA